MDDEQFAEHVRAALDSLPDDIAAGLENVAIVVEDESLESPDILGMFFGYPHAERTPRSSSRTRAERAQTSWGWSSAIRTQSERLLVRSPRGW